MPAQAIADAPQVLLGHVGRGGLSRRGPHEQNWHEFECQDLSRHSTQHSAQYLMIQAAPHSWRSPLSSDELNINRIYVAETRRRFDYQGWGRLTAGGVRHPDENETTKAFFNKFIHLKLPSRYEVRDRLIWGWRVAEAHCRENDKRNRLLMGRMWAMAYVFFNTRALKRDEQPFAPTAAEEEQWEEWMASQPVKAA
ncbi:hypothetical protein HaLaN_11046, partial [Haematococcus lacustris]